MDSRMSALAHLRKEKRSGRDMELPFKKVSIMADSKEGLEKGLSTAEDILKDPKKMLPEIPEHMEDMMSEEEPEMDESDDSEDLDALLSDDKLMAMSHEELIDVIKDLKEKCKE